MAVFQQNLGLLVHFLSLFFLKLYNVIWVVWIGKQLNTEDNICLFKHIRKIRILEALIGWRDIRSWLHGLQVTDYIWSSHGIYLFDNTHDSIIWPWHLTLILSLFLIKLMLKFQIFYLNLIKLSIIHQFSYIRIYLWFSFISNHNSSFWW